MKLGIPLITLSLIATSCTIPDTAMWNERETATSIRMPMEATTKVLVIGNVVSAIRNPFSTTKKGLSMLHNRAEIAGNIDTLSTQGSSAKATDTSIEQRLDQLKMPAPIGGNIDYLIDGKAFFDALENSVKQASKQIDTRVFIFDNDDIAVRYANMLKKKSATVKTRVLMDELGSITSWWTPPLTAMPEGFQPPSSMPHFLREDSKVKVRLSRNPWLITDHTKLFIIDQKEAYLGGMNIGREYRHEWHDMMFRVTGPIVFALQHDFNKAWRLQGGLGDWTYPFHRKPPYRKTIQPGEIPMRILKTDARITQIETASIAAIRAAKKRVYIQNSYYTSDPLLEALTAAARRGVDVRMIYPKENDSAVLNLANEQFASKLIAAKAKVYHYPDFTHVKALVVDDWVCIGSANFDALSMRINEELNIAFTHKAAAKQLVDQLFLKDFRKSKRLKRQSTSYEHSLLKPVIEQL